MSDLEMARDGLEHAAHRHAEGLSFARRAAVLIAILAALLAISEFAAKDAQTSFLANHISSTDLWAQYQAKSVRRAIYLAAAESLASLPNAADAAVQTRIAEAKKNAARMQSEPGADGMEQLKGRALSQESVRDADMHRYHGVEVASGGLQLAIVLASVSVVTGVLPLLVGAALLGGASVAYGVIFGGVFL